MIHVARDDQARPPQTAKQRLVIVSRPSLLTQLLERHGTFGQTEYYLRSRGQPIEPVVRTHDLLEAALNAVVEAIEPDRRRARVSRDDLERFLFADDDVIVIVGQDGLVPNTAKYLSGQLVLGINPDPESYDGVLCVHAPVTMPKLIAWLDRRDDRFRVQHRAMAAATREDGQRLLSLNEVFVGHRTHQSARYRLRLADAGKPREEKQSSSGVICSTGTGCTGWARSISAQLRSKDPLPDPEDPRLAWFVREPFPSVSTGTSLRRGIIEHDAWIEIISEMGEGGTIFADGIETDRLEFVSGQSVRITVAEQTLHLVQPRPVTSTERSTGHV